MVHLKGLGWLHRLARSAEYQECEVHAMGFCSLKQAGGVCDLGVNVPAFEVLRFGYVEARQDRGDDDEHSRLCKLYSGADSSKYLFQ